MTHVSVDMTHVSVDMTHVSVDMTHVSVDMTHVSVDMTHVSWVVLYHGTQDIDVSACCKMQHANVVHEEQSKKKKAEAQNRGRGADLFAKHSPCCCLS
jgi:hypothetical protein